MKKIIKKIVISNDIKRILEGNNALDFSYQKNNIIIPNNNFFETIRKDFLKDMNKIFENKVIVISEDDMLESINKNITDVIGKYPHRIS